jgi:hypothetical protein
MSDREKLIREAAYYKWESAGRPEGRELDFWGDAEREHSSEPGAQQSGDAEEGVPKEARKQLPMKEPIQASSQPHATATAAASAPEAPAKVPQATTNRNQRGK